METVEAHGARIPIVGFGSMRLKEDAGREAILSAIGNGYRHIDTAAFYGNEKEVGDAIKASGVKREDLWVTTKVRDNNLQADDFARSLDNSLELLGLPQVDLLLIHWPNPQVPHAESIGALNKARRDGLTKHIGVCNYTVALLKEAHAVTNEPLVTHPVRVAQEAARGDNRAAGHQPDRGASVSRSEQGDRGLARLWHGDHRLLPDRARPRAGQPGAGAHRRGAWKDRKPGLTALVGAAGHHRHPRLGQAGAAEGEPRRARFLAQSGRDERDRKPEETGRPRCQSAASAQVGRVRSIMQIVEANGAKIPAIGLGTWQLNGSVGSRITEQALKLGYRHLDCALIYGNEKEIGEGLHASGVQREDVWITTKVPHTELAPAALERAVKQSLANLRVSHVNLLLIHWPNPQIPLAETMGAMAKMKKEGYARHIGISNFTVQLVEEAVKLSAEPIVTNQIEWHPYLDEEKVRAACAKHGISVTAYCPIARGRAAGDEVMARIGKKHGKTAGQVSLRWLVQKGAIVIPRTSKVERLTENMSIFDFALTPQETAEVDELAKPAGRVVNVGWAPSWD